MRDRLNSCSQSEAKQTGFVDFILKNLNFVTILGWLVLTAYIFTFIILYPYENTVATDYYGAGLNWLKGFPLYDLVNKNVGFIYFPHAAIFQVPFALMPFTVADVSWRILNIGLLIIGCYLLAKLWRNIEHRYSFFVISLITIPLSYDAIRNGQMNIILTALLCFTSYALVKGNYKLGVFFCILGGALKPYLFIPLLLICGVYPKKCIPTAILGLILFFLFPFAFQKYQYVIQQYQVYMHALLNRNAAGLNLGYCSIYGLLKLFHLSVTVKYQMLVSALAGALVYLYSLCYIKNKFINAPVFMIILVTMYLLLFSSRTEFNTYCMISPFMGFLIVNQLFDRDFVSVIISIIVWVGMFSAHAICDILTPNLQEKWFITVSFGIFTLYALLFIFPKMYCDKNRPSYTGL